MHLHSSLVSLLALLVAQPLAASDSTTLDVSVMDARSGAPISSARIVSDRGERFDAGVDGHLSISLPECQGTRLDFEADGWETTSLSLTPEACRAGELQVTLEPVGSFDDRIDVTATQAGEPFETTLETWSEPSRGRGLSESLDQMPEVFVDASPFEETRVGVRGLSGPLASTSLDGERVPSAAGGRRTATLDGWSALAAPEVRVVRTFSADQDADAVGGRIDLRTDSPISATGPDLRIGGGGEDRRNGISGAVASRWARRLGQVSDLEVSLDAAHESSSPVRSEARYEDGDLVHRDLRELALDRQSRSFLARFHHALDPSTALRLRGSWSESVLEEERRRLRIDLADDEALRELKLSRIEEDFGAFRFDLARQIGRDLSHEVRLTGLRTTEREPFRLDPSFVGSLREADPGQFELEEIGVEDNRSTASSWSLGSSLSVSKGDRLWRTGFKVRRRDRSQDLNLWLFEPAGSVRLGEFLGPWDGDAGPIGPMPDPASSAGLLDLPGTLQRSFEEDAGDFTALEDSAAAFVVLDARTPSGWTLEGGLRVEWTGSKYEGFEVVAGSSESGEDELRPRRGRREETSIIPTVSAGRRIGDWVLRGALSRTSAPPDYVDLVPYRLIDLEDFEIEGGNPDLRSSSAWNLDLGAERAWNGGRLSIDLFAKHLEDFVYIGRSEEELDGRDFELAVPLNGEIAESRGVDLSWSQELSGPLSWLSFEVGGTFSKTSASGLGERDDLRKLPASPESSASVQLRARQGRWAAYLSGRWTASMLLEVGESREDDLILADSTRWDFGAELELTNRWTVFARGENLTDEARLTLRGDAPVPFRSEELGRRLWVGLNLDW